MTPFGTGPYLLHGNLYIIIIIIIIIMTLLRPGRHLLQQLVVCASWDADRSVRCLQDELLQCRHPVSRLCPMSLDAFHYRRTPHIVSEMACHSENRYSRIAVRHQSGWFSLRGKQAWVAP